MGSEIGGSMDHRAARPEATPYHLSGLRVSKGGLSRRAFFIEQEIEGDPPPGGRAWPTDAPENDQPLDCD